MTAKEEVMKEAARIRALGHRFTAATVEHAYFRYAQYPSIIADLMQSMARITEPPKEGEEWA